MIRAYRSEWAKLLRPGQVLGSWGTMVGFGVLLALLLLTNAKDIAQAEDPGQGPPSIPLSTIEASGGAAFAFQATGQLLGIIALVIAAANVATEYTAGTLKVLLVREPRRPVLFAGKLAALWSFVLTGITLTLAATLLVSVVVASVRGIDMGAWWSADGWSAVGQAWLNVTAGAFVWALMGAMLAVLFRSGFPAIGIGIAYPLVVEGLLGIVLPDVVKWMPGSVLGRLAAGNATGAFGDAAGITYGQAAVLSVAYATVFAAVSVILLMRRDVD
ncbi:MAG: type transport system permease protein [Thermoplasmata archaeon]|nr:type transport system permease protein [Thermoplasmata archaeon]MEA3166632.1 type transport system permease protein [Thermoplasmata archaeon]